MKKKVYKYNEFIFNGVDIIFFSFVHLKFIYALLKYDVTDMITKFALKGSGGSKEFTRMSDYLDVLPQRLSRNSVEVDGDSKC